MDDMGHEVRKYCGLSGHLFERLFQTVNRQAIAPFFRLRLRRQGRILDAGSGAGHLSKELKLIDAYFVDLAWEQLKRCQRNVVSRSFIQIDLQRLPFRDSSFDVVICSNVLHYTGLPGLKDLLRVTKRGGQMLLAFLEDSSLTRMLIRIWVSLGLFPPMMLNAPLLDLAAFTQLDVVIKDSATIIFFPPVFQARQELPRRGLITYELERR